VGKTGRERVGELGESKRGGPLIKPNKEKKQQFEDGTSVKSTIEKEKNLPGEKGSHPS